MGNSDKWGSEIGGFAGIALGSEARVRLATAEVNGKIWDELMGEGGLRTDKRRERGWRPGLFRAGGRDKLLGCRFAAKQAADKDKSAEKGDNDLSTPPRTYSHGNKSLLAWKSQINVKIVNRNHKNFFSSAPLGTSSPSTLSEFGVAQRL